jgi:hypothetical protein
VRFLSARPIREAYTRIQQIQHAYDKMPPEKKKQFEAAQSSNLHLDVSRWIVVSVSFRSNDPNEESSVRRFFQSETVKTLKTKAFLSTASSPQLSLLTPQPAAQCYLPFLAEYREGTILVVFSQVGFWQVMVLEVKPAIRILIVVAAFSTESRRQWPRCPGGRFQMPDKLKP